MIHIFIPAVEEQQMLLEVKLSCMLKHLIIYSFPLINYSIFFLYVLEIFNMTRSKWAFYWNLHIILMAATVAGSKKLEIIILKYTFQAFVIPKKLKKIITSNMTRDLELKIYIFIFNGCLLNSRNIPLKTAKISSWRGNINPLSKPSIMCGIKLE